MAAEKDWATHALIDPLIEPDPSDETGLNSHFGSTFAPRKSSPSPPASASLKESPKVQIRSQDTGSSSNSNNPFRRSMNSPTPRSPALNHSRGASLNSHNGYPSPPQSASPRRERFPRYENKQPSHREQAFGAYSAGRPRGSSQPDPFSSSNQFEGKGSGIARNNSLRERYPGDHSTRPLDLIRKDEKRAHRSPHLRKKHHPGADSIDRLDMTTSAYHHEGPYDAALLARNTSFKSSPVAAISHTNEEALKATPRENIIDAISRHRPLEGVADLPPGVPDRFGRVLNYEEGADLQREPGGDYRRWPGVTYLDGDLKGKGEPSYSIEKALNDHKTLGDDGIEMKTRSRNKSLSHADDPAVASGSTAGVSTGNGDQSYADWEGDLRRSNTTGRKLSGNLKKRFGSLRKRRDAS
ncbi:uncharacterized protein BDZ99DRAFT_465584 [Mytilinidion resinicola]|uniref:Pal1-domain-containing protein n=1 Tax=Mytilinidion resinicola TaxID=574789 RepID=A0A6A6YFY0_9PEZI|nr:uncharacterized protein BDZ99DRAFT_465584 [Mytilinidion resinicola]KAF2806797.1 hypothetical protein BDZ99DRAFT_465584 [Mytilinidion resinicola]